MLESICFKIWKKQVDQIDDLVRNNIFFSRAEVFRAAIRHYLKSNLQYPDILGFNDAWIEKSDSKASVSTKLPHGILKIMDDVVLEQEFDSRSQFIREALDSFLQFHQYIFSLANQQKQ